MSESGSFYVSSDIGGTFTDTTVLDVAGSVQRYKASTVPADPVRGILSTFEMAAGERGLDLTEFVRHIRLFSHGTTIATNAVLTRKGARVGLLQTRGFGDTIFINRGYKSTGLDEATRKNFRRLVKPEPFVTKRLVREIGERVDAEGTILLSLDEADAREAVRDLIAEGAESFAVSLLWSFRRPEHERRVREIILEESPTAFVTISSDILPRLGELARTQTAVLNAFLGPNVKAAMTSLEAELRKVGLPSEPLLMRSNGGLIAARFASDEAVGILLSGPVGGVVAARSAGEQIGHANVIATDMGGTSFDVGLIVDGRAVIQRETFMERQAIAIPSVTVDTIGAGGGSIASVVNGRLKVGPESAGAVPGPACYGAGGLEPTVTDADVALGLVNPDNFLGGRIKLYKDLARKAINERVALPLGITVEEAALGIKQIVDAQMSDLIRQATVYRGHDPRDFIMIAYGGAGPSHAFSYGADLGVQKIVIPRTASVLSAHGILMSDLAVTRERSVSMISPAGTEEYSAHIKASDLNRVFEELEADSLAAIDRQKLDTGSVTFERYLDMRFQPQIFDISIEVAKQEFAEHDVAELVERFVTSYEARFGTGSAFRAAGIEITAFRVIARAKLDRTVEHADGVSDGQDARPTGSRKVYFEGGWLDADIWDENVIQFGRTLSGPAVIELSDTTLIVGPGQNAEVDRYLNVIIENQQSGDVQ